MPKTQVDDQYQPKIILNEPLEGFQIQRSVSRYSTANKLWRVLDPRGWELEISAETFEELIVNGSIIKGVIQGRCIWYTGKILRYAD